MSLRRLIYSSRVARHVRFADAEEVAQKSVDRNQRLGLTGILLYTPSHFLQVLEGEPDAVGQTYLRISRDPRHSRLRIIDDCEISAREFGAWAMTAALGTATSAELEALTADGALALLRAAQPQR